MLLPNSWNRLWAWYQKDKCLNAHSITASIFTAEFMCWVILETGTTSSAMSTAREFLMQSTVRWTSLFNIFLVSGYSLLAVLESVSTTPRNLSLTYLRQQYVECLNWQPLWKEEHTISGTLLLSPQQDVHFSFLDPNVRCIHRTWDDYQIQPALPAYHTL